MIEKDELLKLVAATQNYDECLRIVRKYIIHGTPFVFKDRENDYYEFRDSIAKQFEIGFHEVLILGSAKLGYSYHKDSVFSTESDIDVALVNEKLYEKFFDSICTYQYDKSKALFTLTKDEEKDYNRFLKYFVRGWMRPDKLPCRIQIRTIKKEWFNFFKSISYGKSPVGNYNVNAGIFKNFHYLERYYTESLLKLKL